MAVKPSSAAKGMAAIGNLICRLNPYTNQVWDSTTQMATGDMEVCTLPSAAVGPALTQQETTELDGLKMKKATAVLTDAEHKRHQELVLQADKADPTLNEIEQIAIEVERNYSSQWTFKGQTFTVKSAFRIPYRFPVQDQHGSTLYWQTEYLLIGYAGSDGPG